ncbi:MAG: DNA polymerase IV [Solirubrobacterales bacterium]
MFVGSQATILHADLDAFYASVEQRDDPELRGKPEIVGAGVALAASYEAKARGVTTPMGVTQAKRICPEAVVVPPRMEAYSAASKEVFKIFEEISPLVEAISVDEAFIDATGMEHISGTPREMAERIRRETREQVGLPITVGVANVKFIAKVASAFGKPDGLYVVEPGSELDFLHPLDIEKLWGVGRMTSEKLRARGIHTIGDIAAYGEDRLAGIVGKSAAARFADLANARDPRGVQRRSRRKSVGAQRAVPKRPYSSDEVDQFLTGLVEKAAPRLRKTGRTARTVVLGIRFGDFTRISRSHTLSRPTANTEEFLTALRDLLEPELDQIRERGITLIGISLANLEEGAQLELDFSETAKRRANPRVDETLDAVRERFGKDAIKRGVLVEHEEGISVPLLPD